ncbi:hypothetical protein I306_01429 [Cryptococcus gattii EJB2]|uniref:LisH domain-containing protein n=1 Tax=Cryptococcus gattii EJB2 TaxID=1296103 RepID=A0ABR5C0L3_9TREE|nr:hypothetical protein I306_01429 [Cryptococcus gattii EJB2]
MSSATDRIPDLIAHYLATNYPTALEPFLQAAQIAAPNPSHPPDPDLRTVIEDWSSQQLAASLATTTIDESDIDAPLRDGTWKGWKLKDMMKVGLKGGVGLRSTDRKFEGVSAANLLTVAAVRVPKREFDTSSAVYRTSCPLDIVTTSVDKTLKIIDYSSGEVNKTLQPHRAAILTFAFHPQNSRYLLTGSMDGTTVLTDILTYKTLQTFSSTKFVVRVLFSSDGHFMATASYDHHIVIYAATSSALPPPPTEDEIPLDDTDHRSLACEPGLQYTEVHRIQVEANPEAILFHPNSTWLIYTTRSSHLLYYLRLPSESCPHDEAWQIKTKSFNPHPMDTHVSFSVLNMALHPSGRIVACQTGDHRGSAGERILLYGIEPEETERLGCLWTGSSGDDYVLPRMAWVPDGSGIVTTTPNGFLSLIALNGGD